MLEQAESLKDEVDYFVRRLGLQEKDSDKARKLLTMQLSPAEWDCVQCLLSLLGVHSTLIAICDRFSDGIGNLACRKSTAGFLE